MLKFKIAHSFCVCLAALMTVGCNVTADEKSENKTKAASDMHLLTWADSADAEKDASQALSEKDYRLYILAGRGERLVGIDPNKARQLKQQCGTRYIQGSTDVIHDDQHMKALKKAYSYAEKYNQIIAKHCPN